MDDTFDQDVFGDDTSGVGAYDCDDQNFICSRLGQHLDQAGICAVGKGAISSVQLPAILPTPARTGCYEAYEVLYCIQRCLWLCLKYEMGPSYPFNSQIRYKFNEIE